MNEINLNCGVYQIRNIITSVRYSGQSIHLKGRPGQHWNKLKKNKHDNQYLQNSYNKHGRDSFVFEILIYCVPKDLIYYEQLFCDIDKAHGLSYNIRECVESNRGLKHTEETKKNISISKMGHEVSDEVRAILSDKNKGNVPPNKGVSHTEKTKELMKKNHADYKKENHPQWGKHHSEETCKKISESNSGENHPMWGKPRSEETKQKIGIGNKGKVISEEMRRNMSEAAKNRPPMTEETKEKIGRSQIGTIHSEETKEKMAFSARTRVLELEQVIEIKRLLSLGHRQIDIAKMMDISRGIVWGIKHERTWKHIK